MDERWIHVKVHPNAGKDVLVSLGPGRFEAWVKAKSLEGRANQAVTELFARTLQISRERLRMVKGRSGQHKVFHVLG